MSKNKLTDNCLILTEIPGYASNILDTRGGLGGELTVPPSSLEYWNATGNEIEIDGKSCIELSNNNIYRFDKKNLLDYMESVHQEYISKVLQVYGKYDRNADLWKNIDNAGWLFRYNKIKKRNFKLEFDLYMKVTQDKDPNKHPRYYISSKGNDEYYFIIAYCLIPYFTNIRVVKNQDKQGHDVFVFLLEAIGADNARQFVEFAHEKAVSKNLEKSKEELLKTVANKSKKASSSKVTTTKVYDRDPEISAYVKKRANGKCDLCGNLAPFLDTKGNPYLEEHHVKRLADGGEDTINNAVALCPNCHRKVHIVGTKEMKQALLERIMAYAKIEAEIMAEKDKDNADSGRSGNE